MRVGTAVASGQWPEGLFGGGVYLCRPRWLRLRGPWRRRGFGCRGGCLAPPSSYMLAERRRW